ncbi:MAG: hypothetical protein WCA11_06805 [Terracidiphilus sp.]
MFRFQIDAAKVQIATSRFQLAARALRQRGLLSLLVLAAALGLGLATTPANAQGGRLNIQQLGDELTASGKNTVTNNGHTYYTVICGHGPWKSNVIISLSPNGNFIWMAIEPVQLPDQASATALANILKKNVEIGPLYFSINGRWLRLSSPIPNSDMSQAKVKTYLEDLVNTAVDTMPLWDPRNLGGN